MRSLATLLLFCALAPLAAAQPTTMREDAIWAPITTDDITLDGDLSEAAWADAPVLTITYGVRAGDPGSGFVREGGATVADPNTANVRFLVSGDQLYMAAEVSDASIGGSREFNRKDGFLMSIIANDVPVLGGGAFTEYFYSWWYGALPEGEPIPDVPGFVGRFGNFDNPLMRTDEQVEAWDAVTIVDGTPNDDSGDPDTGYTVEMRFDLGVLLYDLSEPTQVPFSISMYDVDGFFPFNDAIFSASRVWWQNAFSGPIQNYGRIFIDPSVTAGGTLPEMPYDYIVPNSPNASITLDGSLDEDIWEDLEDDGRSYDIAFVVDSMATEARAIREAYPGIGPLSSSQFQPELDLNDDGMPDPLAPVLDPARGTFKLFFQGDSLYVGVDVQDQAVTGVDGFDRTDGFQMGINSRTAIEPNDNYLQPVLLRVRVDENGEAVAEEALTPLVASGAARVAVSIGDQTTVNDPSNADNGYQIEMVIALSALGYPEGGGDGAFFFGSTLFDFDAFDDPLAGYGTRAWFFREFGNASAAYALLDADTFVTDAEATPEAPGALRVLGAYPSPTSGATSVHFELPSAGDVSVAVYDALGREVRSVAPQALAAGRGRVSLDVGGLASGVYVVRVALGDSEAIGTTRLVVVR